jgi:hypothetical protein
MPQAPNIDGLPLWLQITVTILFGLATVFMAIRGYNRSPSQPAASMVVSGENVHQLHSAAIADMGAIRHLSDVCIQLTGKLESLEQAVRDQTHWTRNEYELNREICEKLRTLREALDRKG